MDLTALKSARVVTEPEEIYRVLSEAAQKGREARQGHAPHTSVTLNDDGVTTIRKTSAASAKADSTGAPTMPTPAVIRQLIEERGLALSEGIEERAVPYWASDERVDGHGDIVLQNWDLEQYERNPVLQYSHDWWDLPLGNSLMERVVSQRTDGEYKGRALWLLGLFAPEEVSFRADSVYRMVRAGFLRMGSVGFFAGTVIDVQDDEEREALGLGRWGVVLDNNTLVEFSPTPIGANDGALAILSSAKAQKLLRSAADFTVLREITRELFERTQDGDGWKAEDTALRGIAATLYPEERFAEHGDLEEPFELAEEHRDRKAQIAVASGDEPEPDEKADELAELRATVARLETAATATAEVLTGMAVILSDVREGLETLNAHLETRGTEPAEPAADDHESDEIVESGVDRLLAALDKQDTDTADDADDPEETQ